MATQLNIRVGQSAREIGAATSAPEGFVVVDMRTNDCYVVEGGVWAVGSMPENVALVWGIGDGGGGGDEVDPPGDFTYYVDVSDGDDDFAGTSLHPWATTGKSDLQTLTSNQTIGYKVGDEFLLYRKLNMTCDETDLTVDVMTATADQF